MRRSLFLLHSWTGLIAGLGLIVIGLTGSVLVFRQEIDNLVMPQRALASAPSGPRMGPDALILRLREQLIGYEPVAWHPSRTAGRNDEMYVIPHGGGEVGIVWIDPYTGEVQGIPTASNHTLTGWLLDLHYSFLANHAGTFVAGIFAALLCLQGITGVWLHRGFWRNLFLVRWKLSSRIFFSDVHKMVGISSVMFNLILGFTGAYWNLTHVTGHLVNGPEPEPPKMTGPAFAEALSFDRLIKEGQRQIPGFEPTYLSFPTKTDESVAIYGRLTHQNPFRGEYGSSVAFHSQTGTLENFVDIRSASLWTQFTDAFALWNLWSSARENPLVPRRPCPRPPGDQRICALVEKETAANCRSSISSNWPTATGLYRAPRRKTKTVACARRDGSQPREVRWRPWKGIALTLVRIAAAKPTRTGLLSSRVHRKDCGSLVMPSPSPSALKTLSLYPVPEYCYL